MAHGAVAQLFPGGDRETQEIFFVMQDTYNGIMEEGVSNGTVEEWSVNGTMEEGSTSRQLPGVRESTKAQDLTVAQPKVTAASLEANNNERVRHHAGSSQGQGSSPMPCPLAVVLLSP